MTLTADVAIIGTILRDARAGAGLKQKELARKCGVGVKSISTFECGRTGTIRVTQLIAMLSACGVSMIDFAHALEARRRSVSSGTCVADPIETRALLRMSEAP